MPKSSVNNTLLAVSRNIVIFPDAMARYDPSLRFKFQRISILVAMSLTIQEGLQRQTLQEYFTVLALNDKYNVVQIGHEKVSE